MPKDNWSGTGTVGELSNKHDMYRNNALNIFKQQAVVGSKSSIWIHVGEVYPTIKGDQRMLEAPSWLANNL